MELPHERVRALLASAGVGEPYALLRLPGGTNNQVYRVEAGGRRWLLKAYFQDAGRDRVGGECAFLRFAWSQGIRCVPEPLACDAESRLGLFEFIEGRPCQPGEVGAPEVQAALDFVLALNRRRDHPDALRLPEASDACLSGRDYLRSVERRLDRLGAIKLTSDLDAEVAAFVRHELLPAWADAAQALVDAAARDRWDLDRPLSAVERCLSPSDFGFHNALLSATGARFIDFEYAGWDDPAKLVCDFFGQFEVPVPMDGFADFAGAVSALFEDREAVRRRMAAVLPVCRFKWCCIILNDFHPTVRERRSFADVGSAQGDRGVRQLRKARAALSAITRAAPTR